MKRSYSQERIAAFNFARKQKREAARVLGGLAVDGCRLGLFLPPRFYVLGEMVGETFRGVVGVEYFFKYSLFNVDKPTIIKVAGDLLPDSFDKIKYRSLFREDLSVYIVSPRILADKMSKPGSGDYADRFRMVTKTNGEEVHIIIPD